jgi:hypothetical protein
MELIDWLVYGTEVKKNNACRALWIFFVVHLQQYIAEFTY